MRRHLIIPVLGSLFCIAAAAQRPTPEEQQHTLETARELAIHYSSKLPDFICTEEVQRTDRVTASNLKADRLTIQLSYAGQKENYKLVAMNGNPTKQPLDSLDGLITGGEFGSLLLGIFDASSGADFQWKSSTTLRKHPASVYTYRIARAKSHYMLGHRTSTGGMVSAPAGYHGEIVLDSKTAHVLHLTADADDIPKEYGIILSTVEVDYDFLEVAGRSYLLPSHSDSRMERSQRQIANVVTFTGYRKFVADSTIDFGSGH